MATAARLGRKRDSSLGWIPSDFQRRGYHGRHLRSAASVSPRTSSRSAYWRPRKFKLQRRLNDLPERKHLQQDTPPAMSDGITAGQEQEGHAAFLEEARDLGGWTAPAIRN